MRICTMVMLIIMLSGPVISLTAQSAGDSTEDTNLQPFRQGRWLAGLQGFINSSNNSLSFSLLDTVNFTNSHNLDLRAGYLVRDRLPMGIFLSTSRQSTREQFSREVEGLSIGPWARYFLTSSQATLYPEIAVFYTNYIEQNALQDSTSLRLDRELRGQGAGFSVGLGFAYAVADVLVFNVALDNSYLFLFGKLEDKIIDTIEKRNFSQVQFRFSVGFNVLIRK